MATYREYYEDFLSDTLLYREKLAITPRQYMRWAVDGMQRVQRRTGILTASKSLTAITPGVYDIGDDVLEIQTIVGSDGMEIVMSSITQHQMVLDQQALGLNDLPYNFSLRRDNQYIQEWGVEARVAVLASDTKLHVYPVPTGDITLNYVVDIHRFSSSSSQWSAWFSSESQFETNFATTQPNAAISQFDEAFQAYVTMKYMIAIHNEDWVIYAQMWKDAIATIIANKQVFYVDGAAPYNLGPIQ